MQCAGTARVNGVLAVSRAIGDKDLKPWVSAEPEIHTRQLTDGDQFIILASDGLWDVFSSQDAVRLDMCSIRAGG
jgi:serine/threonine protein phosphatase PrpC